MRGVSKILVVFLFQAALVKLLFAFEDVVAGAY